MDTIITTKKGRIRGIREDSCLVFKNIPYAKPPVGNLRFRRPEETEPWEDIKDCTEFGNITRQFLPGNDKPWEALYYKEFYSNPDYLRKMDEDCLNLNIWTPAESENDRLPVAFWIHGGGFGGGFSSEIEFGGEAFAKEGVILVTIEYRCGALGFMAHPWLSEEDELGISGNYGIYDQIAALNWVYDNIAAFGGDPENITVFGQSAGCMSTQVLVSSPLTEGKIAKAILQSGVEVNSHFLATPTLAEEEEFGKRIAELAGVKSAEELRSISPMKLMLAKAQFDGEMFQKLAESGDTGAGGLMIVPNVDGHVLKKEVRDVFRDGEFRKIPYMAGCVADDLGTTDEDRKAGVPRMLLEECRSWCAGVHEKGAPEAFCYVFDRKMPGENGAYDTAFHSAEIWYTLGTLGRCWRPMEEHDYELSREMVTAWTGFMKTGRPGGDWKPCTSADMYVKEWN